MEKNYLVRILESEERINKIVEVLALSPADHFQVEYTSAEVEIAAYTHQPADAERTSNLMLCFGTPQDRIETLKLENSNGPFWVTRFYFSI